LGIRIGVDNTLKVNFQTIMKGELKTLKEILMLIKEILIEIGIYKEQSNVSPDNMLVNSYILMEKRR